MTVSKWANGVINTESVKKKKTHKGLWQMEEFYAWYKFLKTLNCLWALFFTLTKWITIVSQWM